MLEVQVSILFEGIIKFIMIHDLFACSKKKPVEDHSYLYTKFKCSLHYLNVQTVILLCGQSVSM